MSKLRFINLSSKLAGKAFAIGYGLQSAYNLLSKLMKGKNYKGWYTIFFL